MRKFVVKNRQKRKYMRKSEKESLYSFSKTTYGILPILIMAVTFMATVVISTPLRNSLLNVSFKLQLPQLSLSNPLLFFQTIGENIFQVFLNSTIVLSALSDIFINSLTKLLTTITHLRISVNYQPIITV